MAISVKVVRSWRGQKNSLMFKSYLLDLNILIGYLNGDQEIIDWIISQKTDDAFLNISFITSIELLSLKTLKDSDIEDIEKFLSAQFQPERMVLLMQKEVADRIAEKEGSKVYGILSVLLQAYYDIEYLFKVSPGVFHPPPKVMSAVIRLSRNKRETLGCNEALFQKVVKQGFQNRRKTLRNALKPLTLAASILTLPILDKRAEQLTVEQFISLTKLIEVQ